MSNLEELMGHIDYFFEPIKSAYNPELHFEVFLKDLNWTITNRTSGEMFGTKSPKDALKYLIEKRIDVMHLHSLIYATVCTEGTLRRAQLRKCEALVGIESIDRNEAHWDEFSRAMKRAIEEHVKKEDKPLLEIV